MAQSISKNRSKTFKKPLKTIILKQAWLSIKQLKQLKFCLNLGSKSRLGSGMIDFLKN